MMTFGSVKTSIEKQLLETYKNPKEFKKNLKQFNENVLKNKSFSKLFSIYEQLSTPKGLDEKNANEVLNEGLNLISKLLPTVKMPYSKEKDIQNQYQDLDNLVYTNKIDLTERVNSRRNILNILMSSPKQINESIKIPVSSMVKIANQTIENYLENLDENSRKVFLDVIQTEPKSLEEKYNQLKESTVTKLNKLISEQSEDAMKITLNETIEKIKMETFSQINFVRLHSLETSL